MHTSLRFKLIALLVGASLLITCAAVAMVLYLPTRMDVVANEWSGRNAEAVTRLLAQDVRNRLDQSDPAAIEAALAVLQEVPTVLYAVVENEDHNTVAAWNENAAPPALRAVFAEPGLVQRKDGLAYTETLVSPRGTHAFLTVGFSMSNVQADKLHNRMFGLGVALMICLVGVALSFFIGVSLSRPVRQLARMTKEVVQTGDLTRTIGALGNDELGQLARTVQEIIAQQRLILGRLRKLIGNITEVVSQVTAASRSVNDGGQRIVMRVEDTGRTAEHMITSLQTISAEVDLLENNAKDSSASLIEMVASHKEVGANIQAMSDSANTTGVAIEQMARSVHEIFHSIDQLNSTIADTSSFVQRLDTAIDEVEVSSKETSTLSERVSNDAELAVLTLQKTLQGINNIKHSSESAATVIDQLGMRISEIGAILRVIDDVAAQTKLLSLNASIIAEQAGEHGRGFSVVADQIKELAQRTGSSTREISTLIAGIQEESRNATEAMSLGINYVDAGVQLGQETADALGKIQRSAQESTVMIHKIAQATVSQARGSKQITHAIERIGATVAQIYRYSMEQTKSAEQIITGNKSMNSLTALVQRSSEKQMQASRDMIRAIDAIHSMLMRLGSAHKVQNNGAQVMHRNVEDIRQVAQTQASELKLLHGAVITLIEEANVLASEVHKYKV